MSLGGLALAIGMLVDEATVTIENTHAQMRHTTPLPGRRGGRAPPRRRRGCWPCSASSRCSFPRSSCNEPVRSLFMPLTLAVGFAMIASYLLSSTLVPMLSVWLVRHPGEAGTGRASSIASCRGFARVVGDDRAASADRGAWCTWLPAGCSFGGRQPGGHRVVSPGGFRPVRASFSGPSGIGVRVDAEMALKSWTSSTRRPREGGDLDGLRRAGAPRTPRPTTSCCSCGAPTMPSFACG